jgi:hypothetical protein
MSPIIKVPVKSVIVPDTRGECDPGVVSKLAESMSVIGLKTPVTIRMVERITDRADGTDTITDHFLIAGAHRLDAALRNRLHRYPANLDRKAELLAELARAADTFGVELLRSDGKERMQ